MTIDPAADTPPADLAQALADAESRHADEPAAVLAWLAGLAPHLRADGQARQALHLAEHVALAHLGDAAALGRFVGALPAQLREAAPTAAAVQRIRWAADTVLALTIGPGTDTAQGGRPALPAQAPAEVLPAEVRWRGLQSVVLALARLGRPADGAALLAAGEAEEAEKADHGARSHSDAARALAATANNIAAHLQAAGPAPGQPRDPGQDRLMLQAAETARRVWARAGTWLQMERAQYRLALCHAAAGQGPLALQQALACLAACEAGDPATGERADALEHFFAHEALVQAHRCVGDSAAARAARGRMAALLPQVPEADGLRAWCAEVLNGLPD